MAIPDYQTAMLPLLRLLGDGRERSVAECLEGISTEFRLTPEERQQLLPSGATSVIKNRVAWAKAYMRKAVLLEATRRGVYRITERGKDVLASKPARIDVKFLRQFEEFREFQGIRHADTPDAGNIEATDTPEEALEDAYQTLRANLESELLQRIRDASPAFFERLVVELLVRMGYGGSIADAGRAVGGSGDGGIDGIIKEDRLGLDLIYLQAKRWSQIVGRPEVQAFAGALEGHRARKGVFITTSDFSKEAHGYVEKINSKIVLMNGRVLAALLVDHGVGVSHVASYELKKIDSDYFAEE